MSLREEVQGRHTVLTPEGMITGGDSANRLAEALSRAESERTGAIVLDLTNVGHVDSTALGVLVGSMRRLHGNSRELRLVGVGPRIRLLLELTKLDALFPRHASVPDALAAEHGRASTRTEGAPLGDRDRHDV